jgi:predicted membrane chloride channel (bestrophin family)
MVIAYQANDPFRALYTRHILRTLVHPMYIITMCIFIAMRIVVAFGLSADGAKQVDAALAYPATLVGTLFAFLIGFFVNNCYTRYMDNWRAAMIGWSRINDLALQVHGYVKDRTQACEVMRLMNAANHLCYADLSGQLRSMFHVCERRHLLTRAEVDKLSVPGGPPPFYLCACWALATLSDQSKPMPVEKMFVLAMDKSIIEWRQQTTHAPHRHHRR